MAKRMLGTDVYSEAVARMEGLYREGHRVVVSFSGGKDSTVCLHVCREAARRAGKLPVEVVFVDEEISLPGTHDFVDKLFYGDPELVPYWLVMGANLVNIYDRECPFLWPFDTRLEPEQLFRLMPPQAQWIPELTWHGVIHPWRFPPEEGKKCIAVTGIRVMESLSRRQAISKSGSFLTKHANEYNTYYARPLYDWTDGDVWKTMLDHKLRYNPVYDLFVKLKIPRNAMRLSVPTANLGQVDTLLALGKSCPQWFADMQRRIPGVRHVMVYGKKAVQPVRADHETWQQCFDRIMADSKTPAWVVQQGIGAAKVRQDMHARHSNTEWPDDQPCTQCGQVGSWKSLVHKLYIPWSMGTDTLQFAPKGKDFRPRYYHPDGGLKSSSYYDPEGLYFTDEEYQEEQRTGEPPTRRFKKVKQAKGE